MVADGRPPGPVPVRSVGELVRKALDPGNDLDVRRALRWLRLVGADDDADPECSQAIRGWIEAQPERYKALLRESVARCPESPGLGHRFRRAKEALHGATVPSDYGTWCLGESERAGDDPELVRFWFEEAWSALVDGRGAAGLTLERLESAAAGDPHLEKVFDELRSCDICDRFAEIQRRRWQRNLEHHRKQERELADWRRAFLQHETALRENRCPAGVLNRIAEVYRGHYIDFQAENGRERLRKLLAGDTLVEAAVAGLRGAIHRGDLPAPAHVLDLRKNDQRHVLALAVLAGLDLSTPSERLRLDSDQARTAMAFFLAERRSFHEPDWLRLLVESHTDVAADEIVRFATMEVRRGERHIPFVYELSTCEWLDPRRSSPGRPPGPLLGSRRARRVTPPPVSPRGPQAPSSPSPRPQSARAALPPPTRRRPSSPSPALPSANATAPRAPCSAKASSCLPPAPPLRPRCPCSRTSSLSSDISRTR